MIIVFDFKLNRIYLHQQNKTLNSLILLHFLCRVLLLRCKLGVLQYTVVRPVTTVIAL